MKRLTETDKWKNPWFRGLPGKYKLAYLYLLDNCDNVGVMHLDFELISFSLKEEIDSEEFKKHFSQKLVFLAEDKIFIKSFLGYQHNLNNPKMKSHIDKLLLAHKIKEKFDSGELH